MISGKKMKIVIDSENAGKVIIEWKFPCADCRKADGSNSILMTVLHV